jgi:FtsH-binding integral membrane protein
MFISVELYLFLREAHFFLSRAALIIGVVGFLVALYIGVIRHGDVTRWFRRAVYAVAALMLVEAGIGALMYFGINARPHEEVHLIYGLGAILSLPFFVFVETTAKRRPAMGSYIWGFALIAAITLRSIMTGAAG